MEKLGERILVRDECCWVLVFFLVVGRLCDGSVFFLVS